MIKLVALASVSVICFATVLTKSEHKHGDYINLSPAYRVKIAGSKDWSLLNTYDKDQYFVEGLEMLDDNTLIQSAGEYSGSEIQILGIDYSTGDTQVLKRATLDSSVFGEGCTALGDHIYQMTYREGKVYKYDKKTLSQVELLSMPYEMIEGWGLTHDNHHLYASDGTEYIYKLDPETFEVLSRIEVYDEDSGNSVEFINELELVGDHIYANVLPLNIILKINKNTGHVEKKYDLGDLQQKQLSQLDQNSYWDSFNNVMNGIAYRKKTNTFLITGKQYDFVFEVTLN